MTPRFGLEYIAADQAQKHVTHNAALDHVDALLPGFVASATTTTAPTFPAEGEAHIVPSGASGYGSANAHDLAIFLSGEWIAVSPQFGWSFLVLDEGNARVYGGSFGWRVGSILGATTGATIGLAVRDAEVDLTGAAVTVSALIPNRSIVLGVTSWTITGITGATSYDVGDGTTVDRFGGSLGIAAGSSNVGVIGPSAIYADTDVVITANGSDFTAGRVGVAALFIMPGAAPI